MLTIFISIHPAVCNVFIIPVIAVKDKMASYLSLIIAHGIWEEVDPLGRVTAAGHSHLMSLPAAAAAESIPSLSVLQTRDTFLEGEKDEIGVKYLPPYQECVIEGLNGDAFGGRGPLVELPGNPDFLALSGLTFGLVAPYWAIA